MYHFAAGVPYVLALVRPTGFAALAPSSTTRVEDVPVHVVDVGVREFAERSDLLSTERPSINATVQRG